MLLMSSVSFERVASILNLPLSHLQHFLPGHRTDWPEICLSKPGWLGVCSHFCSTSRVLGLQLYTITPSLNSPCLKFFSTANLWGKIFSVCVLSLLDLNCFFKSLSSLLVSCECLVVLLGIVLQSKCSTFIYIPFLDLSSSFSENGDFTSVELFFFNLYLLTIF